MAAPDHMAGINALPRWDPSSPTKYAYDPSNYDAADYAAFKEARQAAGVASYDKSQRDLKKAQKQLGKDLSDLLKEKTKEAKQGTQKAVSRDQVKQWAKAGHTLYADIPSSCFRELKFIPNKDDPTTGTVIGTFYHGGDLTYGGALDLDDWLDATSGDSLGEWYNDLKPF